MKIKVKLNWDDNDMVEFWGADEKNLWCVAHADIFWDLDPEKRLTITTEFTKLDVIADHQRE